MDKKNILSLDAIIETIMVSNPVDDWGTSGCPGHTEGETKFYKENPNIRFYVDFGDKSIQCQDFHEPWANKHRKSKATGYWHSLYFNSTHIDSFILVAVDDARALLPTPEIGTLLVPPLHYKIAQIYDGSNTLDDYMKRSGLSVDMSLER